MITAGVDVGAKTVKVVILKDGEIIGKSIVTSGLDQKKAIDDAYDKALAEANVTKDQMEKVVATGSGRKDVSFATADITDAMADTKGAYKLFPSARTVIDVGAEEGRGIRVDDNGKVVDFAVNEKCAAGAGSFTEAMARALEVKLEELGELSLKSTQTIPMNAQCAVFAESEVVTMVHNKVPKEDMARAVHDAIASRITSMVRKVGFEPDVVLIGGLAYNVGFVRSLETDLNVKVKIPDDPEFVGAFGAALAAEGGL
jgi:benzoyl-CoA reductase subunit D